MAKFTRVASIFSAQNRVSGLKATFVTLSIVLIVTVIKFALNRIFDIDSLVLLYFSAITVSAWYGGFIQGIIATLACLILSLALLFQNEGLDPGYIYTLFIVDGAVISLACSMLRTSDFRFRYSQLKFLDSVIENIPNMIFVKDAKDLKFVRFNRAGERLLGYSRDELIGKSDADLFPPDQAEFFQEKDRQVLNECEIVHIPEEPVNTKFGVRYVETKKIPILDESGRPKYLLGISEDVTEKKEAQKQRMDLLVEQASNRAKTAFMANMSHEMRTPLSAILGFADLLVESKELSNKHEYYAKTINQSAQQLLKIVDEILDISKIESEKIAIEKSAFNIVDLLNEIEPVFKFRSDEKDIAFNVAIHPSVPKTILSDPTRVKQILLNLVGNAIKFTSSGEVKVEIQAKPLHKTGWVRAEFLIKDSGVGIESERIHKLFKPFSRADEGTGDIGGTGLGLYLSRKLARYLGGDVDLKHSVPGQGSEFLFHIDVETDANSGSVHLSRSPAATNISASRANMLETLVIDDTEAFRVWMKEVAEAAGLAVTAVDSGREGLNLIQGGRRFDLILSDIRMPGMDGYETLRNLRAAGFTGPIVAVTAHAMKGDRENCLSAGFSDYLQKPLTRQALLACLESVRSKKA